MATATARKPKTSIEAVPQLATLPERVTALEVKVDNLKDDVKEMHDCLDRTRDGIMAELKKMSEESTNQHNELAGKVKEVQQFKEKWIKYAIGALAFTAGAGWIHAANLPAILKFLGL